MAKLTLKQTQVLKMILQDKTNKQIADELCVGVRSVEKLKTKIFKATGTKSSLSLALYAIKNKIIEFPQKEEPEQLPPDPPVLPPPSPPPEVIQTSSRNKLVKKEKQIKPIRVYKYDQSKVLVKIEFEEELEPSPLYNLIYPVSMKR
jgi:DNA-binding CsgD family transcriptional regulator